MASRPSWRAMATTRHILCRPLIIGQSALRVVLHYFGWSRQKDIHMTYVSAYLIQGYRYLARLRKQVQDQRMSLIIELPQPNADQPISQISDTFSRLMALAGVARDVHIIAPRSSSYWKQRNDHIKHCQYRNTVHNWRGMGIHDTDSGISLGASHPHCLHPATTDS